MLPAPRHLLIAAAVALAGCVETSEVVPIVGPDGAPMLHVSCGANEARCYQLAGRTCPFGYAIARTAGSALGNFLVRCRAGATPAYPASVLARNPYTAPGVPTTGSPYAAATQAYPVLEPNPYAPPPATSAAAPVATASASVVAMPPAPATPGARVGPTAPPGGPPDFGY